MDNKIEMIVKVKNKDLEFLLQNEARMDFGDLRIGDKFFDRDDMDIYFQDVYEDVLFKVCARLDNLENFEATISKVIPSPRAMAPEFHSNIPYDLFLYIDVLIKDSDLINVKLEYDKIKAITMDY